MQLHEKSSEQTIQEEYESSLLPEQEQSTQQDGFARSHKAAVLAIKKLLDLSGEPEDELTHAKDPFILSGEPIYTLTQLYHAVESASAEVINTHASSTHNDFANWVRDCLHDLDLAKQLSKAKNKQEVLAVLGDEQEKRTRQQAIQDVSVRLQDVLSNFIELVNDHEAQLHDQQRQIDALQETIQQLQQTKQEPHIQADTESVDNATTTQSTASQLSEVTVSEDEITSEEIYHTLIQGLSDAHTRVDQGDYPGAQNQYDEIRELFYASKDLLSTSQSKELYNLIRGLYTDIQLRTNA